MPWTTSTTPAQSWTTLTKSAATWSGQAAGTQSYASVRNTALAWNGSGAPSSESRLNAVYPLPVNPAGDLDFVWRIESSGFFVVGTGNMVQIKSRITDGP